jgi:hypothetical protein
LQPDGKRQKIGEETRVQTIVVFLFSATTKRA